MIFSSITFLLMFLPAVLAAYFLFRGRTSRNFILVVASAFFYAWGQPSALLLLCGSVVINYLAGLLIWRLQQRGRGAQIALIVGVIANLSLLGYFKYTRFFFKTANGLFGLGLNIPSILLPAGVSFFTFLGLSYLIDVYRGRGPVLKNPLNLALYQGEFPTVLAGPLVRYEQFAPQIRDRRESLADVSYGIERFIIGFAKKTIIAGGLAHIPQMTQGSLSHTSTAAAWLAALAYTGVIYFDFAGYSDMAIGLGRMFGLKLPENFDYPYASKSISDFWRRWHITMGAWFREYVYIPLGGNRRGNARIAGNLLAVWILTGLWHGSAWTFVVWGLYYGVLLLFERFVLKERLGRIWPPVRHVVVILLVVVGWVIFRAPDLSVALGQLKVMIGLGGGGLADNATLLYLSDYRWEIILAILGSIPTVPYLRARLAKASKNRLLRLGAGYVKPVLMGGLLCLSVAYAVSATFTPFIYFNF